jgi:glycosyltransferase involved in cell wall biosynthesis
MPKICFVESQIYSVLKPGAGTLSSGGEAVQHSLLAREFANQGWSVSAVCRDAGQADGESLSGIRFWKTYQRDAGIPGMRFFYPRLYKVWRALKKADADVYFQSCAGFMTGVVAYFARRHGRKVIFRVAHDTDCVPGEQLINNRRDRWLYEYGLRAADLISVQSEVQADALKKNYGLSSMGVKMVVEAPADTSVAKDIDVLWVNNLRGFKRPELVVDIARELPKVSFVMIGGRMKGFEDLYDQVKKAAESLPNLTFIGVVPYSEVNDYFARAKLFLNTSDSEGFPNSYLQAWVRGVPVISYFDPDGLIESLEIGAKVSSQEEFCAPIEALLEADEKRLAIARRASEYASANYSSKAIVEHYKALIAESFGIKNNDG